MIGRGRNLGCCASLVLVDLALLASQLLKHFEPVSPSQPRLTPVFTSLLHCRISIPLSVQSFHASIPSGGSGRTKLASVPAGN